eukprot:TRINITY_DN6920_c0_g1_i1.p1 TRINITY_DN6920_c0_g1~~TRINITY_DN6920_c0_g1_i1.p1  ORF type:complete len:393 (-),score=70.42 TRINITY_DN6920_c0_g1_i1:197-1375(-)
MAESAVAVPLPEEVPQFASSPEAKAKRLELVKSGSAIVQMLIGDAVGDAFGLGIELNCCATWIRKNVMGDCWPDNVPENWKTNNVRGMYSDDAEMTVALMKGLMKEGTSMDEEAMVKCWMDEWNLAMRRPEPAIPGHHRIGHGGFARYAQGQATLEALKERNATADIPGNAPPMRALPFAFVADEHRERLCKANADTTHPHPKARAASFLIATAARFLIVEHGEQGRILQVCRERLAASSLSEPATLELLDKLEALPDFHSYGSRYEKLPMEVMELLCGPQPCAQMKFTVSPEVEYQGIGSDALRTAGAVLYLLKFHRGPFDVLMASVDLGGDVDSIAALCTAIVGGSVGLKIGEEGGLPAFLIEDLEGVEYLVSQAKAFDDWVPQSVFPRS